jgi:hypothetical protein
MSILTPRESAKDLIMVYVERGDSLESLIGSFLGAHCSEYSAQIGGFVGELPNLKKVKSNQIAVDYIDGKHIEPQIFSLVELFNEIKLGLNQQTLF